MTDHEITQLALKAGKGDRVAMDRVIALSTERVWQQIYEHCGNIDYEDQQDLSQELLLQIFRSMPKFKGQSAYKSWLWTLIHNRINDYYRKMFRRNRVQWTGIDEIELTQHGRYIEPDTSFVIREMLNDVPERYRRFLELYYLEGNDLTTIARLEHLSYEATRSRIRRARAYIAKRTWLWQ